MKKVIFIDWNKTLSYDLFWGHLSDSSNPNHIHLGTIEKWLFIDNKIKINPWMTGDLKTKDIVKGMSRDTGIESSTILNELKHSCEVMTFCIADIKELISSIRSKGIAVVIATDNMDTFNKYTVPALNLQNIFDDILNSHYLGHLKDEPEPADSIPFFDKYLRDHNLDYKDVVLLDDSPDNNGKYKKLGFDRIVIDSPEKLRLTLEEIAYE